MAKLTVKERMTRSIALRKGEVVMRADFESMGSASQISRALKELMQAGKIVRVGYGIYAKARPSILSGKPSTRVSLDELAYEALKKLGVVPRLGRAAAEYASARTTQIPAWSTFNTGRRRISRQIGIGRRDIRFENDYGKRAPDDIALKLASFEIRPPSKTAAMICRCIREMPVGEPFTSSEFLGLGPQEAIEETLSKLAKIEAIMRVTRGVFVRPKTSQLVGKISPTPLKVVELLTKGETIQVHGAEAARRMELSTQVPMRQSYITSGPSRTIRMGKREISVRHISPRKLLLAGRPAGLALTAMWYLGKGEVTPKLVGKIRRKLGAEEFEVLKSVINDMPAWMRAAMNENEKMAENDRRRELREAGLTEQSIPTPTPIPPTSLSPLVYIGGKAALNLPSATGTGDWHMEQTFFLPNPKQQRSRSFISGEGCATDTTSILRGEGIYDCTEILDKLGIPHESTAAYAADHARATADLVLDAVLRGLSPDSVVLDDWMPRDGDKEEVYFLLEEARPHLTAAQKEQLWAWELKNPFSPGYGG
jgi:hypothetical protein